MRTVSRTSGFKILIYVGILDSTTLLHTLVDQGYALSILRLPPSVSC